MTTTTTPGGASPALALLADAAAIATELKRCDLADRLAAERAQLTRRHDLSVVVAAETKRGKSSLVNALIGRDNLLPVNVDVATGVQVAVRHGETEECRVLVEAEEEPRRIEPGDLADWVSTWGNPLNSKHVRLVEVTVPSPLLARGLILVDTPGVGGLDKAHGRLTMASLSSADALLFVLDALAPISEPELAFLERAVERIETVVFVMTKADIEPHWRDVLAEDVGLIAARLPRLDRARILKVACPEVLEATRAIEAGAANASKLDDSSGRRELVEALAAPLRAKLEVVRTANALRVVRATTDELERLLAVHAEREAAAEAQQTLERAADAAVRLAQHVFPAVRDRVDASATLGVDGLLDGYRLRRWASHDPGGTVEAELRIELYALTVEIENQLAEELRAAATQVFTRAAVDDPHEHGVKLPFPLSRPERTGGAGQDRGAQAERAAGVLDGAITIMYTPSVPRGGPLDWLSRLLHLKVEPFSGGTRVLVGVLKNLLGARQQAVKASREQTELMAQVATRQWRARVQTEVSTVVSTVQSQVEEQVTALQRERERALRELAADGGERGERLRRHVELLAALRVRTTAAAAELASS